MACVVCATRGGAGSRAVQQRAVKYALRDFDELVYLYVIDTTGLTIVDGELLSATREELRWLGHALLGIAQRRAENLKVDAEIVIREGEVREEICRFLMERSADLLLLGAPRGTTSSTFGDDIVEKFARSIQEQTGIPVEIIRPDEG